MPNSVILVTTYDPDWFPIVMHLIREEIAVGNTPLVYDITPLVRAPVDTYHRGILKLFGRKHPGHDLRERVERGGGEYLQATATVLAGEEDPLDADAEELLATAVRSAIITFSRTDQPDPKRRWIRRMNAAFTSEGRVVYHRIVALCAERGFVRAYVPNGRIAHQRLAVAAFQRSGAETLHIEKVHPDHVFLQPYSPHDRFRSQGDIDTVLAGLSDADVDEIAEAWLAKRAPQRGSKNEYAALWNSDLEPRVAAVRDAGTPIVGFFTSSQDEFLFQGAEWQVHEWADQFEAFDMMMTRYEAAGYRCFLRVHPNLATRAHDYFLREREGVRRLARAHPDLIVIWHDDRANSYALMAASDAVVIFASTVGVEAGAAGIPVWAAAATTYGEVADIREVFSAAAVESDDLAPWTVDPRGARRYIAYLARRDRFVTGDGATWLTWKGSRPMSAKLAQIAVSGGTPGIGHAIWSLVDQYRHRSLRANLRSWRNR